jgi:hypothetical protein
MSTFSRVGAIAYLLTALCILSGCNITEPSTDEPSASTASFVKSDKDKQNVRETQPMGFSSSCNGVTYQGEVTQHVVTSFVTYPDGSVKAVQHVNTSGHITDQFGEKSKFGGQSFFEQQVDPSGEYVALHNIRSKLTTKGAAPNETLNISVMVRGNTTEVHEVQSSFFSQCSGSAGA